MWHVTCHKPRGQVTPPSLNSNPARVTRGTFEIFWRETQVSMMWIPYCFPLSSLRICLGLKLAFSPHCGHTINTQWHPGTPRPPARSLPPLFILRWSRWCDIRNISQEVRHRTISNVKSWTAYQKLELEHAWNIYGHRTFFASTSSRMLTVGQIF